MVKKLLFFLCISLFFAFTAIAQNGAIEGTLTDAETGDPLPGANIVILGLDRGASTELDGSFIIDEIPSGTYTVRASYVGYESQEREVTVDGETVTLNFEMQPSAIGMDDVVVTAFGIDRETKSVGYSVQQLSGENLTLSNDNNLVGSLSGKISGTQVIQSAGSAIGGSDKVRIRGVNGLSDSQPLFVVDGTPINNESFSGSAVGRDYGNLVSDLNMDNIESVSVLKGAAASALYGSRASSGVVVIETKQGGLREDGGMNISYSSEVSFDRVSTLPEYQDQYAGGYNQDFVEYTDPEDGQVYPGLNYAADESWGPPMNGQEYRPWWSWFHGDFTGDGQDDYGTMIPLESNPDNVRNFFNPGTQFENNLAISGGSQNASYRLSIGNLDQQGVFPGSELTRNNLNFKGDLQVSDRLTTSLNISYTNTEGLNRPTQGYSPSQGNPVQSFNQWFQRQLDMDKLKNYRLEDGSLASWNIRSNTNLRPLYWDSPFFTARENISEDERDRVFGNVSMRYNLTENLSVEGKVHTDFYDFIVEDRIASGGLETDWYMMHKRSRQENNYEVSLNYNEDFQDFSLDAFVGGNIRQEEFNSSRQATSGGLSTPNYFNIAASNDRPDVSTYKQNKEVRSIYGTASFGWNDMIYLETTLRNDWSSALPQDDNSNLYYGFSTSLVFSELGPFRNSDVFSFGKIRASIAQVGDEIDPYQISQTFNVQDPYGGQPAMAVPNTLANPNLIASVSTDYELGLDMRFLQGRFGFDVNVYQSVRNNEVLQLEVSPTSGYEQVTINAGEFVSEGIEASVNGAIVESQDLNVNLTVNWATNTSRVEELAEGLDSRVLENAYFGVALYAREGEEWGIARAEGSYGGYVTDKQGRRIINTDPTSNGHYQLEDKDLGNILPDWTGGTRLDISFMNFDFGAFLDYQYGGLFYSLTKQFNNYSGLGHDTIGDNVLGNSARDPLLNANGDPIDGDWIPLADAHENSGGFLVEGVDESGNEVQHLYAGRPHWVNMFFNKENYVYDASYLKLREVSLAYNLSPQLLENLPITRARITAFVQNAALLYSSVDGLDPSSIQNGAAGFSFWEGAQMPPTRSFGLSLNVNF